MPESRNKFDLAIVGAGVTGASIARVLSAYKLRIAVLEKEADISFGVSKANSGIIHAGFHHKPSSLKAVLEVKGNAMFDGLQKELLFPFKRVGILVTAFSYEEMKAVEKLYDQGIENGVPGLEIVNRDRIIGMEPVLNRDVVGGLYAPTGGIIEPYRFVFALMESAVKNGVSLFRNFEVIKSRKHKTSYTIQAASGETIEARYVVNAAGLYADEVSRLFGAEEFEIIPRKGEEFILDRLAAAFPKHVLFPVPAEHSKGILVIPTVEGTMMIGPTANEIENKEDTATTRENLERVLSLARMMVPAISKMDIITSFAGNRPVLKDNDFYIEASGKAERLIQAAGIQSPGLTASPAIAEYVKGLLEKNGLSLVRREDYDPHITGPTPIRGSSPEEVDLLVGTDPAYGRVVCRCEEVSEKEIKEAINRGHTTLDGIKFYTRAGMGRCQGAFCTYKIIKLLIQELGILPEEITKRGGKSKVILRKL
ncbi:MAG: FAD-dependent oxidoreductase [Spirochaetales bacterium]|nr:FAD-dependent oxidoreductase [Spirochaetales bacterium]